MRKINLVVANGVDQKRQVICEQLGSFVELDIVYTCQNLSDAYRYAAENPVDVLCLSPVMRWKVKFLNRTGEQSRAQIVYVDWGMEAHWGMPGQLVKSGKHQYFHAVKDKIISLCKETAETEISSRRRGSVSENKPKNLAESLLGNTESGSNSLIVIADLNGDFNTVKSIIADLEPQSSPIVVIQKLSRCFAYHYKKQLGLVTKKEVNSIRHGEKLVKDQIFLNLLDQKIKLQKKDTYNCLSTNSGLGAESPDEMMDVFLQSLNQLRGNCRLILLPEIAYRCQLAIQELKESEVQIAYFDSSKTPLQSQQQDQSKGQDLFF